MANIQDEIQAISTAFYGAQVRSAIATGLDSINQEVDSLNSQVTKFDSLAQQMNQIVSEYNTLNTKMQNALQEVNSALKNELDNCTLSGAITNNATIIGGTYKNSSLNGSVEIGKELNINTNAASGTINLNTNVKSIYALTIGGQYGSIFIENQDGQGLVQLCHSNDSVILNNLFTNASIFTFWPSKNNSPSTLSVNNTIVSGATFNECGFNNGSLNNPTLSGNVEVNTSGSQEALIDYYSGTHTQLVAPNVTGKCTISWWLIKAPLLSGQSINGSIGVLTMSITLDSTYNWANNNRQEIDISQLPASSARTITPTPYFQVGTSQGVLWLAGSNLTLEAGKTYTTKALMWQ